MMFEEKQFNDAIDIIWGYMNYAQQNKLSYEDMSECAACALKRVIEALGIEHSRKKDKVTIDTRKLMRIIGRTLASYEINDIEIFLDIQDEILGEL